MKTEISSEEKVLQSLGDRVNEFDQTGLVLEVNKLLNMSLELINLQMKVYDAIKDNETCIGYLGGRFQPPKRLRDKSLLYSAYIANLGKNNVRSILGALRKGL